MPKVRLLLALWIAACGSSATGPADMAPEFPTDPASEVGGERPAAVYRPSDYDSAQSYPLVLLLHGFGSIGWVQDAYFGTSAIVDEKQFVLVVPDGTLNANGSRFWNGTPACCGAGSGVDDVGYLRDLIEETSGEYNIDASRVYFVGHSNGGFMSYRMACEASDIVTAIASLAGATFATEEECAPDEPVSVLQIHGTDDATILYDGGRNTGGGYPSASESVRRFAAIARCELNSPTDLPRLDLLLDQGADTDVTRYESGCVDGVDAELWSMPGAPHIPGISPNFSRSVLDWLLRHRK